MQIEFLETFVEVARHGSLTRRDLARPRLEHVAHQHVVDPVGLDPGSTDGFRDGDSTQVDGRAVP